MPPSLAEKSKVAKAIEGQRSTRQKHPITLPAALEDVAMCTGPEAAAAARESESTFNDGVRRTRLGQLGPDEVPYPQPCIQRPRFTRYLIADVRAWLVRRADHGGGLAAAQALAATTQRASKAAKAKRQAHSPEPHSALNKPPPASSNSQKWSTT